MWSETSHERNMSKALRIQQLTCLNRHFLQHCNWVYLHMTDLSIFITTCKGLNKDIVLYVTDD